jgi:hypothetical protein
MFTKNPQRPETAEAGLIDNMVDAVGVMFPEISDQFKRCRIHREDFDFHTVKTDGDLQILLMRIDTDKEMIAGK